MLLHAFIDQNESMVQATMKAQAWDDSSRTVVVTKSAMTGEIAWEQYLQIPVGSRISGMTTDVQGHVYLAGQFQDSFKLGEKLIEDAPGRHFFLLSFDEHGHVRFINIWQSDAIYGLSGLQVNNFGDIWISGQLRKQDPQGKTEGRATFWMRFDDEGESDRAIVLMQGNASTSETLKNQSWTAQREDQALDSLLSIRGMQRIEMIEEPTFIDDDPDTTVEPEEDPDMVPPPPPPN